MSISLKKKKDISKRKMPFFCILKGLSNRHKLFSFHRHFNRYKLAYEGV